MRAVAACLVAVVSVGAVAQSEDKVEKRVEEFKKQREARMKEALTMRVAQWDEEAKLVRRERPKKPAQPPRRRGAQLQAASAQAEKAVEVKEVKAGTALVVGDALTTGEKRGVTVHAGAVGVQRIQPNSAVRYVSFDPPALDPTKKSTIELELTRGEVLHRTGKLASGSVYRSRSTPRLAASAGTAYSVRLVGTEFEILVAEGEVKVALETKPDETLSIGPRQKALVGQTLPEAPLPVTPEDEARVRRVLSVPIDSLIGYTDPVELRREDAEEIVAIDVRPTLKVERVPLAQASWREYSVVVPDDKTFWTVDRFGERREVGKGFQFLAAAKAGDVILALDPKTKELWSFDLEGNKRFVASDFEGLLSLAPNGSRAVVKLRRWVPRGEDDPATGEWKRAGAKSEVGVYIVRVDGYGETRVVSGASDATEYVWRRAGKRLLVVERQVSADVKTGAQRTGTWVLVPEYSLQFVNKFTVERLYVSMAGDWQVQLTTSGRWIVFEKDAVTRFHDVEAGKSIELQQVADYREIPGSNALFVRLADGSAVRVEAQEQPSSNLREGVPPRIDEVANVDEVPSDPSVFALSPNGELVTFRSSTTGTAHVADSLDLKRFSDVHVSIAPEYECEWVSGDTVYYREIRREVDMTEVEEVLIKLGVKREGARPRRYSTDAPDGAGVPLFFSDLDQRGFIEYYLLDIGTDGTVLGQAKVRRGRVAQAFAYRPEQGGRIQYLEGWLNKPLNGVAKDGTLFGNDFAILPDGRPVALPPGFDARSTVLPNGNLLLDGSKQWNPRDRSTEYPVGDGLPYGGKITSVPDVPPGAKIEAVNPDGMVLYIEDIPYDQARRLWIGKFGEPAKLVESRLPSQSGAPIFGLDNAVYYYRFSRSRILEFVVYKVQLTGEQQAVFAKPLSEFKELSPGIDGPSPDLAAVSREGIIVGSIVGTPPEGASGFAIPLDSFAIVKGEVVMLSESMGAGWSLGMTKLKPNGALLGAAYKEGKPVFIVPNLYDLLSLSTPRATTAAPRPVVEGLPAGEYEGALFRNGRRDESGQDLAVKAATEIRLTIDPDGTYRIFKAEAGPGQTDGQQALIVAGAANLDGGNLVLRPSQKAAAFAFYGIRLDSELRLRVEPDGSLSLPSRPGGLGQAELRFVKRRT